MPAPAEASAAFLARLAGGGEGEEYRDWERAAFGFVRAAMESPAALALPSPEDLPPEARNRLGYLLALAGMSAPWPPDTDCQNPPLFAQDPSGKRTLPGLDALAARWNLSRGADLGRLRQFLRTGLV